MFLIRAGELADTARAFSLFSRGYVLIKASVR
jgi:hypothetical protein